MYAMFLAGAQSRSISLGGGGGLRVINIRHGR